MVYFLKWICNKNAYFVIDFFVPGIKRNKRLWLCESSLFSLDCLNFLLECSFLGFCMYVLIYYACRVLHMYTRKHVRTYIYITLSKYV